MDKDKKQAADQSGSDPLQQINLNDYAGDEADNRIATENADRYMNDLERAKEQGTIKPDEEQPE